MEHVASAYIDCASHGLSLLMVQLFDRTFHSAKQRCEILLHTQMSYCLHWQITQCPLNGIPSDHDCLGEQSTELATATGGRLAC